MKPNPVLYAEDEENDAYFMERAFAQAGIGNPLIIAPNGQQAIDYLASATETPGPRKPLLPDLVLLDLKMPQRSGMEVLTWIRNNPATCTLPVLMVTSSDQNSDIHRAYLQGANGYLVKPSQPGDLLSIAKSIKDFWLTHNRSMSTAPIPAPDVTK